MEIKGVDADAGNGNDRSSGNDQSNGKGRSKKEKDKQRKRKNAKPIACGAGNNRYEAIRSALRFRLGSGHVVAILDCDVLRHELNVSCECDTGH